MELNKDNKIRYKFLTKCYELYPLLRVQSTERVKTSTGQEDLSHILLEEYLNNPKQKYSLLNQSKILRNSIESDKLTELRIDLDDKKFSENLNVARVIYEKFLNQGIKLYVYSSGGKGIHLQALLNIKEINFQVSFNEIDIPEYKKEIISKQKESENHLKFLELSRERQKFKIELCKYILGNSYIYYNIDERVFLSSQMLGLEGGTHRKTNRYKSYINFEKWKDDKKLEYYLMVNNFFFIDFNFFSDINKIPENFILNYNSHNPKPINKKKSSQIKPNLDKITKIRDKTPLNYDLQKVLIALIQLYKEKDINSQHKYNFFCMSVFYYISQDENLSLAYSKSLFQALHKTIREENYYQDSLNYIKSHYDNKYKPNYQNGKITFQEIKDKLKKIKF